MIILFLSFIGCWELEGNSSITASRWHEQFAENGVSQPIYPPVNYPAGIFVDSITYIVWQGLNVDPYISSYNHINNVWSDVVKVGNNPLGNDDHGAPIILKDASDYLHVFYGCHGGALQYRKSTTSNDIKNWTTMSSPCNATYPQVMQLSDGTIYLFYRAGGHTADWDYRTSIDGGVNWNAAVSVIDGKGVPDFDAFYCFFNKGNNDTIHCAYLWKDDNNSMGAPGWEAYHRYNIYYIFQDSDGNWRNIQDSILSLPIAKSTADSFCLVYDSQVDTSHTQIPWIEVDNLNNPYILFINGGHYGDTTYSYLMASWNGTNWDIDSLGVATDCLFDFYALDVISPSDINAYVITGATPKSGNMLIDRGGNLEKWHYNGFNWQKECIIAKREKGKWPYINHPQVISDDKIVFIEHKEGVYNFSSLRIFLYENDKYIMRKW